MELERYASGFMRRNLRLIKERSRQSNRIEEIEVKPAKIASGAQGELSKCPLVDKSSGMLHPPKGRSQD